MSRLLETLGFGSAFALAAATFAVFEFLDRIASQRGKRLINDWIASRKSLIDPQSAIMEAFNNLYTYPLLRPRAFLRSAGISLTYSIAYIVVNLGFLLRVPGELRWKGSLLGLIVAATIVSDYSSLFVVRRWLTLTAQKPIAALLVAPLIGGLVVLIIYAIAFCLHFALWTNGTVFPLFLYQWLNGEFAAASAYVTAAVRLFLLVAVIYGSFMIPTAMVYAWLPMMFFGIIGVRLFHMLTRVVSGAQWFIREGNARPFRAIGLVAAVLVFALAASVQLLK